MSFNYSQLDDLKGEIPKGKIGDMELSRLIISGLEEPWIAFKVLAAGAIRPEEGFAAAFEAGADFICVGMYDFQIVQDSNIALDALASVKQRSRPWRG